SSIHYTGGANSAVYANVTNEGRFGSIFMGGLPEEEDNELIAGDLQQVAFTYKGFTEKQLTLNLSDLNLEETNVQLKWKAPNGHWQAIDEPQLTEVGDTLAVT